MGLGVEITCGVFITHTLFAEENEPRRTKSK